MPENSTMNTTDVLREAKAILSDPARWVQGQGARKADGSYTPIHSPDAVAWCASGAMSHVAFKDEDRWIALWSEAFDALSLVVGCQVPGFNDHPATTHATLIDAFDRAILSLSPRTEPEPAPERVEVA